MAEAVHDVLTHHTNCSVLERHGSTMPGIDCRLLRLRALLWLLIAVVLPPAAQAVIVYSTADPSRNTTAPGGTLTNSGWQFQGTWGDFLGTPVAPKYFITATHIGGAVGQKLRFRGVDYPATATFAETNSDLRLWRICGTFPDYAQMYSLVTEVGQPVVVFGRGTQRGVEVLGIGPQGGLKGWQWGPSDGVQRWGTNVVTSVVNGDVLTASSGVGELLKCAFDASAGGDEAHLSTGDSGGGLFIKDGAVWKLAGINFTVDGPFNTSASGPGFMAAIFDEGGLYLGSDGNWSFRPDLPVNVPSAFYATRISSHVAWINSVLLSAQTDPAPTLQSANEVNGVYENVAGTSTDPVAKTVTVPMPDGTRFYRLQACDTLRITSITVQGANLVITYQ